MEKSSTSANSNMVCKRILNAFADFQKILPFSSQPRQVDPPAAQVPSPEFPGKDSPLQLHQTTPAKAADSKPKSGTTKQEIPILSEQPPPSSGVKIQKTTEERKIEPKTKASEKEGKYDKFTDYIKEAKIKMRSSSDMGGEKQMDKGRSEATRKEESKEKFSNYISRAGNRIRTTSSKVGFGKGALVNKE